MAYAYDRAIALPVHDLYDSQVMAMSINAAKDMYEKGQKQIEDFYNKYGDFISPIQKDMEWYAQNVTGKASDFVNQLYANGIDPLRSAEGRAAVAQLVRSMPIGDIAKVRQSAVAANEYLKNRGALQRAGKYDADLNERFLGYNLDQFDTINGGQVWNVTSPLEAQSLKDLTEKSFNNRSPLELTKEDVESFGVKYDPRAKYTGFAKRHLQDIADKVAPGLYGTPYMDYYRDLAKRKLEAAGIEPTKDNIDRQLANDIADSQEEWLMGPKADLTDFYKRQELALHAQSNQLARDKFNWEKAKYREESGVSQWEQNFNDALANAASDSYTTYDPLSVSNHYDSIGKQLSNTQRYFGSGLKNDKQRDRKFESKYTKPVDVISILKAHGNYKDGQSSVPMNLSDVSKIRTKNDVITNTEGNYSRATNTSKELQQKVEEALRGNKQVRMYPHGTKYGALAKDNKFDIDAAVDIVISDADGSNPERIEDVYWDTGWGTRKSLSHPSPGPANLFRTDEQEAGISGSTASNVFPTMWRASALLPQDTRGTAADYKASSPAKMSTTYKE